MSKLKFQIPELHYQTVEVDFDGTIGDALNVAYLEGEGDLTGDALVYHKTLNAEDYPVRMLDENGKVEARYWYNAARETWEQQPAMWHGVV